MPGRISRKQAELWRAIAGVSDTPVLVEVLECRTLLSVAGYAATHRLHSDLVVNPAATSSSVDGYTPSQIRKAYGFDQISFGSGGSVAADGRGQTIAIVDAFNDPNIAADLNTFDAQFGLPAADLKVVNQTGGTKLPSTDAGWAGEIALDVEWAHAIAPAASIVLVEANSDTITDLMAAVDTARHMAGVSAVSMSWGGSEFFNWGGFGGESQTQLQYDKIFTTPAGHQGVTFIAAAGDSGQSNGVQWPASSPNVVAVGGTALITSDSSGTYFSEDPWRGFRDGTSGGFSQVESEPSWQQTAQQSGARSTPDVGYNADPNTGFAVYDSVPDGGHTGWDVVGGTSAGSPQWAALVAIANQGRALAGQGTLDGTSQTLPALYSVYSPPGTTGYAHVHGRVQRHRQRRLRLHHRPGHPPRRRGHPDPDGQRRHHRRHDGRHHRRHRRRRLDARAAGPAPRLAAGRELLDRPDLRHRRPERRDPPPPDQHHLQPLHRPGVDHALRLDRRLASPPTTPSSRPSPSPTSSSAPAGPRGRN